MRWGNAGTIWQENVSENGWRRAGSIAVRPSTDSRTKVSVLESFDPLMRPDDDDDFMLRDQRQGSPGFET